MRVSETNNEASTPKVTTTPNDLKNMPTMPSMKITGAKIQMRESDAAMTAKVTSDEPLIAALIKETPQQSETRIEGVATHQTDTLLEKFWRI